MLPWWVYSVIWFRYQCLLQNPPQRQILSHFSLAQIHDWQQSPCSEWKDFREPHMFLFSSQRLFSPLVQKARRRFPDIAKCLMSESCSTAIGCCFWEAHLIGWSLRRIQRKQCVMKTPQDFHICQLPNSLSDPAYITIAYMPGDHRFFRRYPDFRIPEFKVQSLLSYVQSIVYKYN